MSQLQNMLAQKPTLTSAVVGFAVRGDEVLLMHRIKGLGQGLVSGIGGKVGDEEAFAHETPDQALVREFQEEIGITPTRYRKVGRVRFIWTTKPKWSMDVAIYLIDEWHGEPIETDVAKPIWHKINDLPTQNMWEDNLYWVPRILDGEYVDAVFLYGPDEKIIEHVFN